ESAAPELELRNGGDGLVAIVNGAPIPTRLRQCFPWSQPHRHISLRDAEDREIVLVEDPAKLPPESRRALEQALAEAAVVREVTRVLDIDEEVEIRQWQVETENRPAVLPPHPDRTARGVPSRR